MTTSYSLDGMLRERSFAKYLVFFLGTEEYAIETSTVLDILECALISRIVVHPLRFFHGTIRFCGERVPVVDLRLLLSLEAPCDHMLVSAVIIGVKHFRMGLLIDSFSDLVFLDPSLIRKTTTIDLVTQQLYFNGEIAVAASPVKLFSAEYLLREGQIASSNGELLDIPGQIELFDSKRLLQ